MPGYVIVNVTVRDPVRYEEYRRLATPTVGAYEGRYIVRGGQVEVREGSWSPSRLVILEFPTAEDALSWWNSPEYMPFKQMRHAAATCEMLLVEGV